jgi:CO dehydrogenase maturation factor
MSTTIAVSGKGGSGKTTLAAMILRRLIERGSRGILAVDADPNACLGLALGAPPGKTVADLREETLAGKLPGSDTDRERAFELALHQILVEANGFDLVTMGRPEGPKCYCAVNHLLRRYLDQAGGDYRWVVIDNEAGMEHLSRRTTTGVDLLLIVTETTAVGVTTARRILDLAGRLPIAVKRCGVLWNKVPEGAPLPSGAEALPTLGRVPLDPAVLEASMRGATVFELDPARPSYRAVGELMAAQFGL